MSLDLHGPTSHYYISQRLRLHYVDWGNADKPPLLLVHGTRDHCRSWDWVARELRSDYHVMAPDLRGHGDSEWLVGANYSMVDYVYDISQLLHQKQLFPITIIGHSLGGSVSVQYTGVFPENVVKLVTIEGLGPAPRLWKELSAKPSYERMRDWIQFRRDSAARMPRRYPDLESAYARMQEVNPHLSEERARHLTAHAVNQNEDGTYSWKFDNFERGNSPYPFNEKDAKDLWGNITCPTLLVRGLDSWISDYSKDGRLACFQNARQVNIPNAGHWVHHDQFDLFMYELRTFLDEN